MHVRPVRTNSFIWTGSLLVCLLVAFAIVWFAPLDLRHLIPNDEGRYAEMAREMFTTGDWITPRYNGYKYFEKPPLQTWANALTFAWFGIGDWQARLYTALTGFGGVLLLGYTATRLYGAATGFYAAVILAGAPYWAALGHYDTLDMGLSFWMEWVLCALLLAQRTSATTRQRHGWMLVCWAGMAAAVLSKGLVGLILPGSVLIVYSIVSANLRVWQRLHILAGLTLFMVIVLPWFFLVQKANPEFFHFFFIVQQFERYLTPQQNRPGPFLYFVPVILLGFLPWLTLAFPTAGTVKAWRHPIDTLRRAVSVWRADGRQGAINGTAFTVVWGAFIFLFFSVSHSKLIPYVLPVAPAIALLLAHGAVLIPSTRWQRHLQGYLIFLVIAAVASFVIRFVRTPRDSHQAFQTFQWWVFAGFVFCAVMTWFAMYLARNPRRMPASFAAVGCGWLGLCLIAGTGHDALGKPMSGAPLAPAIKAAMARAPADTPFYAVEKLDHTLPFYIGHTTIMVQGADELAFGVYAEPEKWIPNIKDWEARWRAERYAFALMNPAQYRKLVMEGLPMTVIAADAWRVVVEKPQTAPSSP
ncbi:4-amino-4-deoxy-L-arabinose transferase [Robbsia andropogonis]|uniref:4-amino-4-deoxy-L-arabinose transferase n=1 Tax=Robbsia andropogonis TaxID=28092 RepID=A0A0F5JVY7_9BURK|nr:glycosyltransferase family 39 protein [Robbsia andropogonis]KKB61804.1 4-amino-4-deoxy-L-arabinose transferase [Robbsia andropogonis]MCP1121221.1 glycosyltransferase family 39 protein [Robbsia andropogonis]MCP1131040.1 glycosyltransferase family 39 protein [Robbsia andropogonis]